jgi:hypothetical protein
MNLGRWTAGGGCPYVSDSAICETVPSVARVPCLAKEARRGHPATGTILGQESVLKKSTRSRNPRVATHARTSNLPSPRRLKRFGDRRVHVSCAAGRERVWVLEGETVTTKIPTLSQKKHDKDGAPAERWLFMRRLLFSGSMPGVWRRASRGKLSGRC